MIMIAAQAGLLMYGTLTLRRMKNRNRRTDEAKREMDAIRALFRKHFDPEGVLQGHQPFGEVKRLSGTGGLRDTVLMINWMLVCGIVVFTVLLCTPPPINATHAMAYLLFVAAGGALFHWFFFREGTPNPTYAGGVVFRDQNGAIQYLLVRPSKGTVDEWLLPKELIEAGENARETAIREVCEEGGVYAPIIAHVGNSEFTVDSTEVRVSFYLMRVAATLSDSEPRERAWLGLEEALLKLTYPRNRELLCKADVLRRSRIVGGGR